MNLIKKLCLMAMLVTTPVVASAAGGPAVPLDPSPHNLEDQESLQRGAKLFVQNCLSCHSAQYMRYNRMKDIGWDDKQIETELGLGGDTKVGDTMHAMMDKAAATAAFGVAPPDLSVIARSRSADWLYTYMHSFYSDPERASGTNNTVFPNVGMPNVFMGMQGTQELINGELKLTSQGSMSPQEFDAAMTDLTNYLVFMGEPAKLVRYDIGTIVLGFLALLFVLVYALKREIWKDMH